MHYVFRHVGKSDLERKIRIETLKLSNLNLPRFLRLIFYQIKLQFRFLGMIPGFLGTIPGFLGAIPGSLGAIPGFLCEIPVFHGEIPFFQGEITFFEKMQKILILQSRISCPYFAG